MFAWVFESDFNLLQLHTQQQCALCSLLHDLVFFSEKNYYYAAHCWSNMGRAMWKPGFGHFLVNMTFIPQHLKNLQSKFCGNIFSSFQVMLIWTEASLGKRLTHVAFWDNLQCCQSKHSNRHESNYTSCESLQLVSICNQAIKHLFRAHVKQFTDMAVFPSENEINYEKKVLTTLLLWYMNNQQRAALMVESCRVYQTLHCKNPGWN